MSSPNATAGFVNRHDYVYHLFSFYWNSYHGQCLAELFSAEKEYYFYQAIAKLEQYKRNYTVTAPDANAEDMAICAMADALYYFANSQNDVVTSASIGAVSVNYAGQKGVDLSPKAQERELFRCASQYLEIYRGVC